MSLGSIAHMQHYFARTGLLDGKGAQVARVGEKNKQGGITIVDQDNIEDESMLESQDHDAGWAAMSEPTMLPPTVSTYREKTIYYQPLPDMFVLRQELRESLDDARKVLQDDIGTCTTDQGAGGDVDQGVSQGWHEIQGLNMLDLMTTAIRAAKNYYTCHSNPQKLYTMKSERQIRSELYQVMDTLKRMANREFRGGVKDAERQSMSDWIDDVDQLLLREDALEQQERAMLEQWSWLKDDWQGREREREYLFLQSFNPDVEPLAQWTESTSDSPCPLLKQLQSGIRLVHLHNALVNRSKRRFEEIRTFHTDLNKPYRCADNLRYWIKAAVLRWEVKLQLNVLDLVYEKTGTIWQDFDSALLKWSAAVREELTLELLEPKAVTSIAPPLLQVGTEQA